LFCPKCRSEYRKSVEKCVDCDRYLVEELPPEPQPDFARLVTVFIPDSTASLLVAKSILEEAGIKYYAKNEGVQDLFALGRFGTGFNPLTGPPALQVACDDAEEAKSLLEPLTLQDTEPAEEPIETKKDVRWLRWIAVIVALVFLAGFARTHVSNLIHLFAGPHPLPF